jgi:hypothetical protein
VAARRSSCGQERDPLAIGPAILRYRVYDIDPLISRTVSYVFLTALLLGVYGGGVVGLR